MNSCALYIHIPFCVHRCAYCDFNTYAGQESRIPDYVAALCREILDLGAAAPAPLQVHSVFFGGGTPSLLQPEQVGQILDAAARTFALQSDAEISLEANPGTIRAAALRELRAAGINRISFGVQSAHPEELRLLERIHDFFTVIESVRQARQAGFTNLNLDLIYALPEQPLARWQQTLRAALDLQPEHLSLYALTLEHGTPFARWVSRGLLPAPDPDLAADMYAWAQETLDQAGYRQYEISNWAQPGYACRHNLTYWRGEPYLGVGAGAHGYLDGVRTQNVLTIQAYIRRMSAPNRRTRFPASPAAASRRVLSQTDEMDEFLMMGLRLTDEGVSARRFAERFGRSLESVYPRALRKALQLDLVEWVQQADGPHLRLRPSARLLGNQAFQLFLHA